MDLWHSLHLLHLVALCAWGGIVMAEGVIELRAETPDQRKETARVHYLIDLFTELPTIGVVLLTGVLLTWKAGELTHLHAVKITCGLLAIAANLYCANAVVLRWRNADNDEKVQSFARTVRLSGFAGLPFAAVAAYLGLVYFHA